MSTDLETLLREAAEGPVPHLDLAEVRRRGRRRRRTVRAASASGVGAVAGVVALGLAFVPDLGAGVPVVDAPVADAPVAPSGPADPRFEVVDDDGCTLRFVEDGEVAVDAPLSESWGTALCGSTSTTADVRAAGMLYSEIGRTPARFSDGEPRFVGVLDGAVAEVELLLDDGERISASTHVVRTPGAPAAGFIVDAPAANYVLSVSAFDASGALLGRHQPTPSLHAIPWRVDERSGDREPVSEAVPVDDLPVALPGDLPPFGTWRPGRSPVELAPLSVGGPGGTWYVGGDTPSGLVGRDAVADRLGSEEELEALCVFLHAELAAAGEQVDLAAAPYPEQVGETLVHMVLHQEGVLGGDGLTITVAAACGLSDRADG